MDLEELQNLYDTNIDFKMYVNAWLRKTGIELWEAFKLNMIQEYAKLVKERE